MRKFVSAEVLDCNTAIGLAYAFYDEARRSLVAVAATENERRQKVAEEKSAEIISYAENASVSLSGQYASVVRDAGEIFSASIRASAHPPTNSNVRVLVQPSRNIG